MFPRAVVFALYAGLMGLIIGGTIVGTILTPEPPRIHYYENSTHSADAKGDERSERRSLWIPQDSTGFFALWTAVFTGVLAFSTALLWNETAATARIAERALTEHERPWLFMLGSTVSRRDLPGQAPIPNNYFVNLRWKNVGRSPAVIRDCRFIFEDYTAMANEPDYSRCLQFGLPRTVAVGEEIEMQNPVGPAPGPNNAAEKAMWGKVIYAELGGKTHTTGFCIRVSQYIAASVP